MTNVMREEERIARALGARLGTTCADAELAVGGAGVHWKVEAKRGPRRCTINCFWYDAAIHGLMLGMNPTNARSSIRPAMTPYHGAEYLVRFLDGDGREVADGRARDDDVAVASIAAWLAGDPLTDVEQRWPYVDETRRRFRHVLAILEPRCGDVARCVLETKPVLALWVYGDERSCQVHVGGSSEGVSFRLGHAQVAYGTTDDVAATVDRWVRGASLADIAAAGAVVEPHAELLEAGDAARWHWEHTRERIEDDRDVLAESRPLLRRLAHSDIATRFFSYSSLNRFCFSASSHYPWVDDGLPIISPPPSGRGYFVQVGGTMTECTLDDAIALVERTLHEYPTTPFFGSATRLLAERVNAELDHQGSALRARLVQHTQWYRVEVCNERRRCTISDVPGTVAFDDGDTTLRRDNFDSLAEATAAIVEYLRPT